MEFEIDTIVEYTCFPGYQSKGFMKAKCLFYNDTVQWFGPDLKCIREYSTAFYSPSSAFFFQTNQKSILKSKPKLKIAYNLKHLNSLKSFRLYLHLINL